jgi:hypothetical protein
MEPTFASQLRSFGIDATLQTYSGGNFRSQKNAGELNAWPAEYGLGYASTVQSIWYWMGRRLDWAKNHWRFYPQEQVDQIEWSDGNQPETNRPSTYEPYVVRAPPVGEPDGALQDYQVAKRGMQARFPTSEEQFTENVKVLSWVFNYQMPVFPIANQRAQHFMDTAHWNWPAEDADEWMGVGVAEYQPEDLIAYGSYFHANPENPESGASVEN